MSWLAHITGAAKEYTGTALNFLNTHPDMGVLVLLGVWALLSLLMIMLDNNDESSESITPVTVRTYWVLSGMLLATAGLIALISPSILTSPVMLKIQSALTVVSLLIPLSHATALLYDHFLSKSPNKESLTIFAVIFGPAIAIAVLIMISVGYVTFQLVQHMIFNPPSLPSSLQANNTSHTNISLQQALNEIFKPPSSLPANNTPHTNISLQQALNEIFKPL